MITNFILVIILILLVMFIVLMEVVARIKVKLQQTVNTLFKMMNVYNDRFAEQANTLRLFNNLLKDHLVNSKIDSIKLNRHEQAIGFLNLNHEKLEAGHELICDTIGKDRIAQGVINGDFYVLLMNLKKSFGFQYNPRLEKILSEITDQVNLHNEISDIEHGLLDEPENGDPEGQKP